MTGANVAYPADAGLLAKAVGKLVRAARRVQAAGGATGTVMTDRRRAAGRRAREMAAKMRARAQLGQEERTRVIARATGDLADLAQTAAAQAAAVLRNGRRAVRRALSGRVRGRLPRALGELAVAIERTATVAAQARSRLAGQMPDGATRLVSLHDPDAWPIRKGRIDRPVEFRGTRLRCWKTTTASSWITPWNAAPPRTARSWHRPSTELLAPARCPAVTADRGYGQAAVEQDLHAAGVRTVAMPRQATTSAARKAIEHGRGFRRLVKWRTGCEGRISYLKRSYGWDRARLEGRHEAAIWCGHGVFTHNLAKITALAS